MRRGAVALLSAIVVGILLVPSAVSAGSVTLKVSDPAGDLGFGVDFKESAIRQQWQEGTPIFEAGYFDMVSTWLSQKGKVYKFGMEVAACLPLEGEGLPMGIHIAEWAVWINPSPYHYALNPVPPLYLISLRYDGATYTAFVLDRATMVTTPVPFTVDGATLELQFSSTSIGGISIEWWSPGVREFWGPPGSAGSWFVDMVDLGTIEGQVYCDLPWPPV